MEGCGEGREPWANLGLIAGEILGPAGVFLRGGGGIVVDGN